MEIDKLIEEIEKMKEAHAILYDIYIDIGPYFSQNSTRKISDNTLNKLRKYFNFNDNE